MRSGRFTEATGHLTRRSVPTGQPLKPAERLRSNAAAERGLEDRGRVLGGTVGVVRYVQWQGSAAVVPEDHRAGGVGLDPGRHLGHEVGVVAAASGRVAVI